MNQRFQSFQDYISAFKRGFELVQNKGLITNNIITDIQKELEKNNAGFRKLPGTNLKNASTGEVVYTPPQDINDISRLMSNLEKFINDPAMCNYDPIVKMAIIHYQFESIHPFYDGNGRTGRIINILYLILENLQTLPILYLSKYIIKNKTDYYRLLQQLRENYKFYSQDLLNNLFKHPYTKIEFIVKDLKVSRITAANYLNKLADDGLLRKEKIGTGNYYVNESLFELLTKK
jgi:Fic family protein